MILIVACKLAELASIFLAAWALAWSVRLSTFMIDTHNQAGFKEWWPPVITNQGLCLALVSSGLKKISITYSPDLYLIPTAGPTHKSAS